METSDISPAWTDITHNSQHQSQQNFSFPPYLYGVTFRITDRAHVGVGVGVGSRGVGVCGVSQWLAWWLASVRVRPAPAAAAAAPPAPISNKLFYIIMFYMLLYAASRGTRTICILNLNRRSPADDGGSWSDLGRAHGRAVAWATWHMGGAFEGGMV